MERGVCDNGGCTHEADVEIKDFNPGGGHLGAEVLRLCYCCVVQWSDHLNMLAVQQNLRTAILEGRAAILGVSVDADGKITNAADVTEQFKRAYKAPEN